MSDTSSGWSTSDDDSSGNEYSVRTKQDKLEEMQQKKLHKKSKRKKKKHKKEKKSKKAKYKSDGSSDYEADSKKNNNINPVENQSDKGKLDISNKKNVDIKNGALKKGCIKNGSSSPSPRRRSPDWSRSKRVSGSRSPSKDKKRSRSASRGKSPNTRTKPKYIPASYRSRSPERRKSKDRSTSRDRSKSRSRSRSRIRSRSRDRGWKSTPRRSTSRDRRYNRNTFGYNRRYKERSRSRDRRNRSRSRERKNRSRSRDRRRSRSRSKSYDKKRYKSIRTPSPKKDIQSKSPLKDNSTITKTTSSWDVKVTTPDKTFNTTTNGSTFTANGGTFVSISAVKTVKTEVTLSNDKMDQVFSHSKSSFNSKGIEIKLPPSAVVKEEKEKEDPKSHLYGKWETYEPQSKGKTDLSKFTKMCQEISAKEGIEEPIKTEEIEEPVHHPFAVKQAPLYTPPNFPMKTPTNPAQAIMAGSMVSLMAPTVDPPLSGPLEKHFPVSSGTDHRKKCNATETDIDTSNTVVYEETKPQEAINVSAVIARRLGAQQILTTNPNDYSAQLVMAECDQKLKKWSDSNKKPGKFTGEVGIKMNKKEMFTVGSNESTVQKDFFHNLRPVLGGIGMKMLQNMGWKEGQPLGKSMQGFIAPISIDVKVGRAGLYAEEEMPRVVQWPQQYQTPNSMGRPMPVPKKKAAPIMNVGGKHPVSALAEICTKRKMGIPEYTVVSETGHSYAKDFLMKVQVESVAYQPSESSPNKKHAKAMAATVALQTLGLLL